MDGSTLYPGSGHDRAKAVGPVIASVSAGTRSSNDALADSGRAAEFAGPDDQSFVEKTASRQIIEQRAECLVGRRHQAGFEVDKVSVMRVPVDARRS